MLAFSFLVISFHSFSQNRTDLERQRKKLDNKIRYTDQLLKRTQKSKEATQTELIILNKKISYREELISNITSTIRGLEGQIQENYNVIQDMEEDLAQLKAEYAKMIYYAYKNRNAYDRLMFIFSSANFDQAYKRMKYLQQYSEYRTKQAALIAQTQELLNEKTESLLVQKQDKEGLLSERTNEKKELSSDLVAQRSSLNTLKSKEQQLSKKYKKYKAQRERLNAAIKELIRKELAAKKGTSKFELTPAEKELAQQFELNKGKLPWPVERGQAFRQYGKHPHPVLKNVVEENKGIDILTNNEANALAIFDGTVSAVILIPGSGKVVMISHGNYRSVYTNLKEVFVKKGDKVKTRQKLGKLLTDEANTRTEAHLEIWKITPTSSSTVNPAIWLAGH